MARKERIFYLDFIRAFATVVIVLTHYNALYLYLPVPRPEAVVLTASVGNIYIGNFGVSLFLIISGAALWYAYGYRERVDWAVFYKKRFVTLFPPFWLAYIAMFLYLFFFSRQSLAVVPGVNLLLSLVGMDGYFLAFGVPTLFLVGEWFLGFILLIYLIFPAVLFLFRKFPAAFGCGIAILYVLSLVFFRDESWCGDLIPTRLPEFAFGMYYIRYFGNRKIHPAIGLGALAVPVLNAILKPTFPDPVQTTYIGIASFLFLVCLAQRLEFGWVRKVCAVLCRYSYACFIIHHRILFLITDHFDLTAVTTAESYLLFLLCCAGVAAASFVLFHLNRLILRLFSPHGRQNAKRKIPPPDLGADPKESL